MDDQSTARDARQSIEWGLRHLRYVAQNTQKMIAEVVEFERQLCASIEELELVKVEMDLNDNQLKETTVVTLPVRDVIGRVPVSEMMTQLQVAKALSVSRTTLWKMRKEGRLPPQIRVSDRRVAFRRTDVEAWIEQGGNEPKGVESKLPGRPDR
jgi:excisionase family DNA binding protein